VRSCPASGAPPTICVSALLELACRCQVHRHRPREAQEMATAFAEDARRPRGAFVARK
jgi:hypothetical protein